MHTSAHALPQSGEKANKIKGTGRRQEMPRQGAQRRALTLRLRLSARAGRCAAPPASRRAHACARHRSQQALARAPARGYPRCEPRVPRAPRKGRHARARVRARAEQINKASSKAAPWTSRAASRAGRSSVAIAREGARGQGVTPGVRVPGCEPTVRASPKRSAAAGAQAQR